MELVKFNRTHLKVLELQADQQHCEELLENWQSAEFEKQNSYTLLDENGRALIIAGLFKIWEGRYAAWALVSKHAGKHFLYITREVKRFLEYNYSIDRIECYVETFFHQGHRWAKLLGFERECTMRKYQYGRDTDLYARISKNG